MKVSAGVILIIAAILNLFASFGYFAGGALTTAGAEYADDYAQTAQSSQDLAQLSDSDKAQIAEVRNSLQAGSAVGGGLMIYGIFLLVSVGILIAGAVFLFKDSNAKFVVIAGAVAIVAELLSIYITSFGFMNVLGIVGGTLALIAAKSIGNKLAEEPIEASA